MINEIEKYINKYTFLRYALLFYLISLAGQLILLREEGISIDNFKYYKRNKYLLIGYSSFYLYRYTFEI